MTDPTLTHLDARGQASMVDVTDKAETDRIARAMARIHMAPATLALILDGGHPKGDVLAVARIAGIQAAKKTWDLIPLCHPLLLTRIRVDISADSDTSLLIQTQCRVRGVTGVEMEALTAASVAALTLYDMCKAVDRGMVIEQICLLEKQGGRSGTWQREEATIKESTISEPEA